MRRLLPLLAVLALLLPLNAAAETITVHYPVAVVLYGAPGPAPGGRLLNTTLHLGNWTVTYVFNISFVEAPGWAVEELQSWLAGHGEEAPPPPWARGCPGLGGAGNVTRVELVSYYRYVTGLSRRIVGQGPRWVVSVVALPGPRVLWAEAPYPWAGGGLLGLEGLQVYTGWLHASLVDLWALQGRHPAYPMPFTGFTPPVDCFRRPLLPALRDPAGAVEDTVEEILLYHVANLPGAEPWAARRLTVDIYIVDYGGPLERLLAGLDTGEVERLIRLLDPWLEVEARLHIIGPGEAPWGGLNYTQVGNATVIDLEKNRGLVATLLNMSRSEACRGAADECRFSFYWLLVPGDAYMTMGGWLNFTGLDLGAAAVATYPGYGGRVLHSGASRVVAHEAGHGMGLPHPFQRGRSVDWSLDYAYTVMSYCDSILAAAPWGANMTVDADKLALLHALALLPGSSPAARREALSLLARGEPVEALEALTRQQGEVCPEAPEARDLLLVALLLLLLLLAALPAAYAEGRTQEPLGETALPGGGLPAGPVQKLPCRALLRRPCLGGLELDLEDLLYGGG